MEARAYPIPAKPLDIVATLGVEYEHLVEGSGDRDNLYRQARAMSHRFRDAILALLFGVV
jgi:superfamily II DNA helicase RecQ